MAQAIGFAMATPEPPKATTKESPHRPTTGRSQAATRHAGKALGPVRKAAPAGAITSLGASRPRSGPSRLEGVGADGRASGSIRAPAPPGKADLKSTRPLSPRQVQDAASSTAHRLGGSRALPRAVRSSRYDNQRKLEDFNLLQLKGMYQALTAYVDGKLGALGLARSIIEALFDSEFRGGKRWDVNSASAEPAGQGGDTFACEKSAEYDSGMFQGRMISLFGGGGGLALCSR